MNTQHEPRFVQEELYQFPYHYVTEYRENFRQHFYDSWGINYVSTIELLIEKLSLTEWTSLLDIGCGDGRLVREISISFPTRNIEGIDYSARAVSLAKALNPTLHFSVRDICHESHGKVYDVVVLMEVYEHIPPKLCPMFIEAVWKLLKPGGRLYVTVPHINKPIEPHHFRHFDLATLKLEWSTRFRTVNVMPFERRNVRRRIIQFILGNGFFILTNKRLLNYLYRFYKREMVNVSSEICCQRLLLEAVK